MSIELQGTSLYAVLNNYEAAHQLLVELDSRKVDANAKEVFNRILANPRPEGDDLNRLNNALKLGLLGRCEPVDQEAYIAHESVQNFFQSNSRAADPGPRRARAAPERRTRRQWYPFLDRNGNVRIPVIAPRARSLAWYGIYQYLSSNK